MRADRRLMRVVSIVLMAGAVMNASIMPARAFVWSAPGDADGDGMVTPGDAILSLRSAVGLSVLDPAAATAADLSPESPLGCHGDGHVDVADAIAVMRLGLGLGKPASDLPCRVTNPIDGAQMALVPAGPFPMGSDASDPDERPAHRVDVDAFYIQITEVTNAQFTRFVAQTGYTGEGDWEAGNTPGREQYPVTNVTWNDAAAYTFWAGLRLPTEAEWEKAARGTDGRTWPWGEGFDPGRFNYGGTQGGLMPVGSYPGGASPYGVLDMAGNACEWLSDWYDPHYYAMSPPRNPRGPATGKARVVRGGSWEANARYGMAMSRSKDTPHTRGPAIGFRCVLSLNPEEDP